MDHPEYVTYVVIVYAVTFGLLAAYGAWLWQRLRAEAQWVRQRSQSGSSPTSGTPTPGTSGAGTLSDSASAPYTPDPRGERHD